MLVLYEQDSTLPANRQVAQGIEDVLSENGPRNVEIFNEYLDLTRFPGEEHEDDTAALIAAKYAQRQPDIILSVGPGALDFALRHRGRLVRHVPILFAGADRPDDLPPDVGGALSRFDLRPTVELAHQLQPEATSIVAIAGSSDFDKSWLETSRDLLGDRFLGRDVTYVTDLTLEEFRQTVSALDRNTIVLLLTIYEDAAGTTYLPRESAAALAAVSAAPTYAVYETHLGSGIVGGHLHSFAAMGRAVGRLALNTAAGNVTLPAFVTVPTRATVDWRQLVRFGIPEDNLPPGIELRYFNPGPWRAYRSEILIVTIVLLLQTATIGALLLERRRRRDAIASEILMRGELTYVSRTAQLGVLSGAMAHELNQPLTSIIANAEAGSRMMRAPVVDTAEIADIFSETVESADRAAMIIRQLRSLFLREEVELALIDLNAVVTATKPLLEPEAALHGAKLDIRLDRRTVLVRGNFTQLQQVLLNLVHNGLEAMRDNGDRAKIIEIASARREDGSCSLAVADHGPGVEPEKVADLFRPFHTGRAGGLGLGLSICAAIAKAHNARISLDPGWRDGARFVLTFPGRPRDEVVT